MTYQIKQLEGYPAYYVSNIGEVFSTLDNSGTKGRSFKLLKGRINRDGYLRFCLRKNGKGYDVFGHRLVLEAFVGSCPDGMEARHINGIPNDNRLENITWGTHVENQQDKILHGTDTQWKKGISRPLCSGEKHPASKLTDKKVRVIKHALAYNAKKPMFGFASTIAKMFNVHRSTIGGIARGLEWKHVTV